MGLKYDGNLHSNVHTRMFIPSEMRWVFELTAEHALPCLHGPHACQTNRVNIFDEDSNEYMPSENTSLFSQYLVWIC